MDNSSKEYILIDKTDVVDMMSLCESIITTEECRDDELQNTQLLNAAISCNSYCVFAQSYQTIETIPKELQSRWELVVAFDRGESK